MSFRFRFRTIDGMGVTARAGITCSMMGEKCEGNDDSGGDNGDGGDSGDVWGSTGEEGGGVPPFSRSDSEEKRGGDGEAGVGSRASSDGTSPSAVSRGNSSSTRSTPVGISQLRLVMAAATGAVCSELKLELEVVLSEHPNSTIRQIQSEVQRNATASIAASSESAVVGGGGGSDSSQASVKDGVN